MIVEKIQKVYIKFFDVTINLTIKCTQKSCPKARLQSVIRYLKLTLVFM